MVLAAAKAAREGESAPEVAAHVAEARGSCKIWFAIDTLEFLRRGGRIGAASAWIGSTLKVKPILTVENEMTPVERVRTSPRAPSSGWSTTPASATSRAPTRWSAPAHQRAGPVRASWWSAAREVFGHGPRS